MYSKCVSKGVKLKWRNFISLSCGVLELLRKNLGGAESAPPSSGIDRVKRLVYFKKPGKNLGFSRSCSEQEINFTHQYITVLELLVTLCYETASTVGTKVLR